MKKLALVIPSLNGGGSERVFSILANELSKYYTIELILLKSGGVYLNSIDNAVEVVELHSPSILKSIPKLIKILHEIKPDVIMSTLGSVNLIMAVIRPLLPKARLIARESSILSLNNSEEKYPKLFDLLFKIFYKKFDLIICQSKYMQKDMVDNYNVDVNKTIIINNPVYFSPPGIDRSKSSGDSYKFVAVGRLEHVKGYDLLLDAFKFAVDKGANIKLTILGEGSQRNKLVQRSTELGLDKHIYFAGFVAEPSRYLKNSDALVISSRYEGFPNVVLEAGVYGLPVIGLNSPGGLSEIINNAKLGVLVENFDTVSFADAMIDFSPAVYSKNEIISTTKMRYSSEVIVDKYRVSVQAAIEE